MEYKEKEGKIILDKQLNNLDKFVFDFVSLLEDYVIVSGYVSILLGRSRATEDVDLLVPNMKKGKPVPNIEFKFIKNDLDIYSFENKLKVIIGKNIFFISPLEMQIAFKLFLAADGTKKELRIDKDVEDARYIYKLFSNKINKEELLEIVNKLNIADKLKWL